MAIRSMAVLPRIVPLAATLLLALVLCPDAEARDKKLSVQVRTSPVREKPSPLGRVLGKLRYGTPVDVLEDPGKSWVRIKSGPKEPLLGWMRSSALTSKKLSLEGAGTGGGMASADEVALAGKGFDEKVEKVFRQQNRNLDRAFAVLDRIEKDGAFNVAPGKIAGFLAAGGVKPKETS